jgi:hypothetical protein
MAGLEEAKRLMRVVAEMRLERTAHLIGTAVHFAEFFPQKQKALNDILIALEEWNDGTTVIVRLIRSQMAAVAAGETLYAPRGAT